MHTQLAVLQLPEAFGLVSGLSGPGLAAGAARSVGFAWQQTGGTLRNRDRSGVLRDGGRGRAASRGSVRRAGLFAK